MSSAVWLGGAAVAAAAAAALALPRRENAQRTVPSSEAVPVLARAR
jgi:hypothetical protein